MRIGLACDLKETVNREVNSPEDALEEYDSPETVATIITALESAGHKVTILGGGLEFLENVLREKVDMVFNISEGRGNYLSREAQVPSVLEMLDIPYSGSNPQCLAICLDKPMTKRLVSVDGIRTPKWRVIDGLKQLDEASLSGLNFPAIIKPAYEGSSKGIRTSSLISEPDEATKTIKRLLEEYRQPMMVEEFIPGDEVTVGIIGNDPPQVLGIMQILPRKQIDYFVYSIEVKRDYLNLVDYECPPLLNPEIEAEIAELSIKAFTSLGCRDFARIDFRISPAGKPYFIEINPLPGLGSYSDLVIMALKLGFRHDGLINSVLDAALKRYPRLVAVR